MWPVVALLVVTVLLIGVAPRLLPRWTALRRVPGPALVAWQAVALAGIFSGLMLAPLAVLWSVHSWSPATVRSGMHLVQVGAGPAAPSLVTHALLVLGLAVSGVLLARLLLQGHRIGTALRRARREHTELVDLLANPGGTDAGRLTGPGHSAGDSRIRVLPHPTPTAYCVPGRGERVVLTDGVLAALPSGELAAVLAHERAHLRYRHDLVLEFLTVVDTTVPPLARSRTALTEVKLLIEALADRAAVAASGPVPLARALCTLADGARPESALGAGSQAELRIRLLTDTGPHRLLAALVLTFAALAVAVPATLVWGTLIGVLG